jgi:hypothetical protein
LALTEAQRHRERKLAAKPLYALNATADASAERMNGFAG